MVEGSWSNAKEDQCKTKKGGTRAGNVDGSKEGAGRNGKKRERERKRMRKRERERKKERNTTKIGEQQNGRRRPIDDRHRFDESNRCTAHISATPAINC